MTSFDRTWSPATHSVSTRGQLSHIWHKNENKVQENVLDKSRTQICYDRSNLDTFVQVGWTQDHLVPCRTHTKTAAQCVHPNIAYGLDEHQTKAWTCGMNWRQADFVGWTSDYVGRNLDKMGISRMNTSFALPLCSANTWHSCPNFHPRQGIVMASTVFSSNGIKNNVSAVQSLLAFIWQYDHDYQDNTMYFMITFVVARNIYVGRHTSFNLGHQGFCGLLMQPASFKTLVLVRWCHT